MAPLTGGPSGVSSVSLIFTGFQSGERGCWIAADIARNCWIISFSRAWARAACSSGELPGQDCLLPEKPHRGQARQSHQHAGSDQDALSHDLSPHRIEPEPAGQSRRVAKVFEHTLLRNGPINAAQDLSVIGTNQVVRELIKNVLP